MISFATLQVVLNNAQSKKALEEFSIRNREPLKTQLKQNDKGKTPSNEMSDQKEHSKAYDLGMETDQAPYPFNPIPTLLKTVITNGKQDTQMRANQLKTLERRVEPFINEILTAETKA
jgi:hypothetical protein